MCRGWRCFRSLSSGWGPADTGGAQEALDALETHAVGSGEGCGGGAVAVSVDQLGDVALIEALAQAPRTFRARPGARTGPASTTVWQSRSSAAWVVCE
jgi:hypothetical protein